MKTFSVAYTYYSNDLNGSVYRMNDTVNADSPENAKATVTRFVSNSRKNAYRDFSIKEIPYIDMPIPEYASPTGFVVRKHDCVFLYSKR